MPKIKRSRAQEMGWELYPYQQVGVNFLRSQKRAYLADEMGLGKSAQMIRASVGRTLIVAPATLVDSKTWQGQVDLWADDPSRFTITAYSRIPSRKGRRMSPVPKEEFLGPWDTVILDEAHYLKNSDAIRTKACRRVLRDAERVYLASGTPIPNWAHELFVPLQILHPDQARAGARLGSYWRWVEKWFRVTDSPFALGARDIGRMKGCTPRCDQRSLDDPCEHYRAFVAENMGKKFLRRLRDDVLQDLPGLQVQEVRVPMKSKQWTEYRRMREQYIAEVGDEEQVAWSVAARHTRLDQITTSLDLLQRGPVKDYTKNSGKLERLSEDLQELVRPAIVVGHYRTTVEAAAQVARGLGKRVATIHGGTPARERAKHVEEFQEGKIDVLVGSYDTISEGLTLTAADTMILLEKSYKAARNDQVIRRIHRLGQTRNCLVLDYISVGPAGQATLDVNKRKVLESKRRGQEFALTGSTIKEML